MGGGHGCESGSAAVPFSRIFSTAASAADCCTGAVGGNLTV